MATPNQTQVTEDEQIKQDDTRFKELNTKPDRTEQENTELGELKTKYAGRAEKRIGQLSGEKKVEREARLRAEERAEEAERKAKELEEKLASGEAATIVGNESETENIAGKKYYTDGALLAQIKSGKITEQAAIDYQNKRNEEEIVVRVKTDFQKEQEAKAISTAREEDAQAILNEHPEFSVKHANHNPNDPLYVQWKELVADGYGMNPKGLTKALKKAKQILGIKNTHIDRSGDLGLEEVASPGDKGGKQEDKEVPFSEQEEKWAIDMYTRGDYLNPKTNRPYTEAEAIAKAKEAKKARRK